jgi:hypothetical protein
MIRAEFEKLRRSGSNGRLLSGLRRRGKVIDWDAALDPERPWADVYVTCFTQLEDSLRMWRGYGAERGYALTFDVGALRGKAFLVNVRYDRRRAAAWIRDLLRSLVAFYKAARNDRKLTVNSLVEALKQGLGLAAAIFKREQWRDEQEWRLIEWFSKERTLEFRERDGRIVPYLEVAIPEAFQLKEITIGPGHHHAIEKKAVELLKRRYLKGQRIKVRQSKVSLRPH